MAGMTALGGTFDDSEMWNIVNYLRHLPAAGSLGSPEVFKESEPEHERMNGTSGESPTVVNTYTRLSGSGAGVEVHMKSRAAIVEEQAKCRELPIPFRCKVMTVSI